MSQLDISIFYSHLLTLLLTLYIFSHIIIIIIVNYYYNNKLRSLEDSCLSNNLVNINNSNILVKIFN